MCVCVCVCVCVFGGRFRKKTGWFRAAKLEIARLSAKRLVRAVTGCARKKPSSPLYHSSLSP